MKKMRKAKVITALSLTVVMLMAMTGIAAANPSVVGNVHVAGEPGNPIEGATVNATCDIDGVVVGPAYSDYAGNYGIDLSETACKVGDAVTVTGTYGDQSDTKSGTITAIDVGVTLNLAIVCLEIPIPEFATIAIPVASILGLVLFFNHRKRRKD